MVYQRTQRNGPFQSPIQAHSSGLHALRFLFAWSVCTSWLTRILAPFFALSNLPPRYLCGLNSWEHLHHPNSVSCRWWSEHSFSGVIPTSLFMDIRSESWSSGTLHYMSEGPCVWTLCVCTCDDQHLWRAVISYSSPTPRKLWVELDAVRAEE